MATARLSCQVGWTNPTGLRSELLSAVKDITLSSLDAKTLSIANGVTAVVYDPTGDALDVVESFDFLMILSTQTVLVELTVDEDGADHTFVLTALAGVPFILGSDDSLKSPADLTGSSDVIDRVRIKNASGQAASVQFLIGKT